MSDQQEPDFPPFAPPDAIPAAEVRTISAADAAISQINNHVNGADTLQAAQDAPESTQDAQATPVASQAVAQPKAPKTRAKRHLQAVFSGNTVLQPDPPPDDEPEPDIPMSEGFVSDRFAAMQKEELRYVGARNTWYVWQDVGTDADGRPCGGYWKPDARREVDRRAVEITRSAINWPDAMTLTPDAKRKIRSLRFAGSVRDMARSDRRIAAEVQQFDQAPYLLGVPGGVVDLKLGKVIEPEREHYITRQTLVPPERGNPEAWLKFIAHICNGDQSLIDYLHRWCGYLICGDGREECLLFCYGPAQRGKSKFVNAMREMLGTYGVTASMETFTESRMERHSEELASLAGARMIAASETEAGRRWNESRIKALTGRDMIRARMLHENSFEFQLGKIVIAGNHAPSLRSVDDTFRRRLHILEFNNPVPEDQLDLSLDDKFRAEYGRILQWCIEGCLAWQDCGLGKPEVIAQAVEEYLEAEDTMAEWLGSNAHRDLAAKTLSGELYSDYRKWAEAAGEFVISQKRFVQQLKERGFTPARSGGKRYVLGLRLIGQVERMANG